MLTEICGYLNNYFDVERRTGLIKIQDEVIYCDNKEVSMEEGQYFALLRKNFVLGVYIYGTDELDDKEFSGAIWMLDIPQDFLSIASEIEAWQTKYGGSDNAAMSPFNSESFGGYNYSKGSSASSTSNAVTWQDMYRSRLAKYKKVSLL